MNAAVREMRGPAPQLTEVLSPSQVRCFSDCAARWYFKYALGLPDPKNGNLALGIAVHEALGRNLAAKMETGADLPASEVLAVFDTAWSAVLARTELRDDENAAELAAAGRALVAKWMLIAAPEVRPTAIEIPIDGVISGVRVQGIIDVLEESGRIIDIKTASKKPSRVTCDQAFQLATYVQLLPGASREVRVDTLVKTKDPQLVRTSHTVGEAEIQATVLQYPLAQEAMRSGYYMPNRSSNLCSRRNCAFWRQCMAEYGGSIEG